MERRATGWRRIAVEQEGPHARRAPERGDAPTHIEAGCEIDGHLTLAGPLVIEGEFRGRITCRDDVTVHESGTVEAPISARSVVIEGAVVGDVEASREVIVHATGRLHGSVVTPCLVIERGGFFQGSTQMYRPEAIARRSDVPDADLASPADPPRPPPGR